MKYKKANTILNNALRMLGYSQGDGNEELAQRIRYSAVITMNLVYSDLWRIFNLGDFEPIESLGDEIKLPQNVVDNVFLYGLAMHIARSENDGDQQQYFAHLYNAKRAGLSQYEKVKNIIPRVEE